MDEKLTTEEFANDVLDRMDGNDTSATDSRFRLIVVASLRAKQLLHGSHPRVAFDPLRQKNTSIALEEVRRRLVRFSIKTRIPT
jgi:DNA-directed RNA polymerase omega subunit